MNCYALSKYQALNFPLRPCTIKLTECVMKDWWLMTSLLQEHLKASCFYFACLTKWRHFWNISKRHVFILLAWFNRIASQTSVCLLVFFPMKTLYHYWNNSDLNSQDLVIPDMMSQLIQIPRLSFFCSDSWSASLGLADVGTLTLDPTALKCQNPICFS